MFTQVEVTGSGINLESYPEGTVLTFTTPDGTLNAPVTADGTLERARIDSAPGTPGNGFKTPVMETITGYGPKFMR